MSETNSLVERLKKGERTAFDELYDTYHLPLYRSAYLILGNAHDVEDVLQDTFVTAWTQIEQLRDSNHLKAWLYRIMTHSAYKIGKGRKREQTDAQIVEKTDAFSVQQNNLNDVINRQAEQDVLWQALRQLKHKHREVLVLFYYNDLSIREIAHVLGCFEGTVKSRLHQGKKALQKILLTTDDFQQTGGTLQ